MPPVAGMRGADDGLHVVVLGGGIAGLTAAYALHRRAPQIRVTVVEASPALGGALRTGELAGRPLETGADAFLARVPEGVGLCRELGLGDDVVSPATSTAAVWARGRLRPLPQRTHLGVPTSRRSLVRSRVLSPAGLLRASVEPWVPGRPVDADVAVGALVARRFGRSVASTLVDPLLGGVYAGRADELSLDATLPAVATVARAERSLLRGLPDPVTADDSPVFASVRGGLSRLVAALAQQSGARVLLGTRAVLAERIGSGWRVTLAGGRALIADAVVVAVPAPAAATLLRYAAPAAAAALDSISYADVAIVGLAYPDSALRRAPRSSGFLVPAGADRLVKACTWASAKWPELAGAGHLVRASVGRAGESAAVDLDDADLVARVHEELARYARLRSGPVESTVTRWRAALPQYAVGHLDRVDAIERALAAQPRLAVAGAAYRGVGIPACIRSGAGAASQVLASLQ